MVQSAILIGGLYPAIVQKFQVQPNEQAKEAPYVQKNLKATREAYGIDDTEVSEYSGTSTTKDKTKLRDDAENVAGIRLMDPNVVGPTFQQLQQVRNYYGFPSNLAVDRYKTKDGKIQDTVIGLRELNLNGVPKHNWINDHFRYTHGFGVVAAKGTEADSEGRPVFTEYDLPSKGDLGAYQQRVYYGEKTTTYSIVGGPQEEIDYSDDSGEKTTRYTGKSGVNLANPLNRAAYAVSFGEPQILYSGAIGEGSRILYNRTPKERVEAVAPWLTIDGVTYPAVVDGRIQWIVDAYTTTNGYPYASRTTLGDTTTDSLTAANNQRVVAQQNQVNYIRNSVKATVDAYTGEVKLYQWDTKDPVLKTWMKAFPGTVQPKSDISASLMEHLRYPQDLFKVQRELLTRYHVEDAQTFLSGSEVWQIPDDPTNKSGDPVPPYYLSMKLPGEKSQAFSLTTTMTPNGRDNLSAFMSVNAEPQSGDYGRISILKLPTGKTIDGPKRVQSQFNSEPSIAESISLLQRGDSKVEYGNLLTVPLDGGLLYVEPVYVRGGDLKYPLLRKVLVTYGGSTAFENTLDEALNKVFGANGSTEPPDQGTGTTKPPATGNPTVQQALDDAQKAFDAGQEALKKGDWQAYGQAQKDLEAALKRAEDAQAKAGQGAQGTQGGGGAGAGPSATPKPGATAGATTPKPTASPSG
jgi:uncharacterized membrane protein (UPF0182 family)